MSRRREMVAMGGALPYDAEVEYLENSGTQYIDTGIVGNQNTTFTIEARRVSAESRSRTFGSRIAYGDRDLIVGDYSVTNATICFGYNNFHSVISSVSWDDLKWHRCSCSQANGKMTLSVDDTWSATGNIPSSFTTPTTLALFSFYNQSTGYIISSERIRVCKIWDSGTLVRDFVPVRVGSVGYMYDRVSKQLFGNAGSGAFIVGPDKT